MKIRKNQEESLKLRKLAIMKKLLAELEKVESNDEEHHERIGSLRAEIELHS